MSKMVVLLGSMASASAYLASPLAAIRAPPASRAVVAAVENTRSTTPELFAAAPLKSTQYEAVAMPREPVVWTPAMHKMIAVSLRWALKHSANADDVLLAMVSPAAYRLLEEWRRRTYGDIDSMRQSLDSARSQLLKGGLEASLVKAGATVSVRAKGLWSTFHKTSVRGQAVHDVLALRVVVKGGEEECFRALESIRRLWPSQAGRFKDYVSNPKANGYAALHDTVVLPGGRPVEVQIRTEDMHRRAEFGSAAHRRYKGMAFEMPSVALIGISALFDRASAFFVPLALPGFAAYA